MKTKEERARAKAEFLAQKKAYEIKFPESFCSGDVSSGKWIQVRMSSGSPYFTLYIRSNASVSELFLPENSRHFPGVLGTNVRITPQEALELARALVARYNHWAAGMNTTAADIKLLALNMVDGACENKT